MGQVLLGWYSVEAFSITAAFRNKVYLSVTSLWEGYEKISLLNVATTPVLSYQSRVSVDGTSQEQCNVLSITVSEAFVIFCLKFLFADREAVLWHGGALDPRLSYNTGVLVPLPS